MEWKEVRLGDVCTRVCSGGTPKSTNLSYYGGEIPWLNTKEIDFNRIYSTEKTITDSGLNNSSAKWIVPNTVTVAMYGATAGKSCIVKVPMTTNQACCNLTINDEVADYEFVYYSLKNDYTTLASLANGGAQQNLNAQIIKDYVLKMPSLADQRRIASILSSLDRKIELNNKINADLEEMAQAIFKNWFVDFEPFKDGKFVDSELEMIPEGWKVGRLDEIADVVGGSTPSKAKPEYYTQKGIAWLTPKDLSNHPAVYTSRGEIDITKEGYNSTSTKLMPKGTILFTSRAPIGYISIAQNDICTNQGFKSLVPKKAGTCFLYCFLKYVTPEIENKSTGSTFKEASGSLMKSLKVIMPEQKVFEDFETIVSPLFARIESLEKKSSRLSLLRDTLLPRLMSGELEVPE
ncbi:restriction endonuclease subunit S [Prevotella copri]|jgi:type I restriction enzyme S subunit|uniref:restriction endonuclease subunit S n=1 Tax=Segatella copri TaxID=165179 RepID=UPI001934274E|nr:restriction endonuclease subunit S [Segatella copri]MBM0264977.1 restriction endonuclease subunit S [Segatella copri]